MTWRALHLFSGLETGALGFQRAGFESVGAFDVDAAACRDLTYLTGEAATRADLATFSPTELRAACSGRPDVVFTSPPCKAFSGCLPSAKSCTPKYVDLSSLALRGIWLALEAWVEHPPALFVMENVPRIMSRGRRWIDQLTGLLRGYGYAVRETTHDCGELGGLAQRRRRFLLVARHVKQVPELLYEPPRRALRGIGEVLGELPVPLPEGNDGGPMHRLGRMSAENWVRLALIPAGGDWRDLPASVALTDRRGRQNGGFGVEDWAESSHAVIAEGTVRNTRASVADPRINPRREGSMGVTGWSSPSTTVIAAGIVQNGPWQVADPRLGCEPRSGAYHVHDWAKAAHTVIGHATYGKGAALADPRVESIDGTCIDLADKTPRHLVIKAADGTWHRPMTTLELAALQGFPVRHNGEWLQLDGKSHAAWRQRIGNAVPPPAAEAIAKACLKTSHLPPHVCYVEPFGGSAAVLLNKARAEHEYYNDADLEVVHFFKVLRDHPQELIRAIDLTPYSRIELEWARYLELSDDPVERARRFYVRSWQARGGYGRNGWKYTIKARKYSRSVDRWAMTEHLGAIVARLKEVNIECGHWRSVVARYDAPSTLAYLDPPYIGNTRGRPDKRYVCEMLTEAEHAEMLDEIQGLESMVVLSGYPSALYDQALQGWSRLEIQTKTQANTVRTECLWLSPNIDTRQRKLFAEVS